MNEFSAKQDNSGLCWFCGQAISDLACGNCGNCDNGRRKDKRKKSKPTYAELEAENKALREENAQLCGFDSYAEQQEALLGVQK